ncbi:Electron transfer flavoprotein-ubiquinone oxidoreductase [Raoultella planticola]|uniref:Electron transfer flavoprotein-ubiquinone oxidoreductase n=1 Tax=Raoultella planticola TaxID=575 RepID=A0A485D0G5_RAOPL|nr:Electron transfer flavoprotein-ubiquinone oxidoreductase [Raoultella planticola]
MERETMEFDVLIVGGGPAGLSAACRLMQMAQQEQRQLSVCVIEKGAEVGAHILSGALFEPRALNELFPDWQSLGAPLNTPVTQDELLLLRDGEKAWKIPAALIPAPMHNAGNYVISLGGFLPLAGPPGRSNGGRYLPRFCRRQHPV